MYTGPMTEPNARQPAVTNWAAVWEATAGRMGQHWAAGRGHLLTEDAMRMCLIESLADAGVGPSRLTAEVYTPTLGRGKVDLCIDGYTGTVVELKYPRDPASEAGAADTMILGELLRDFCRVAVIGAQERWVAQIIHSRLARYLSAACARYGLEWAAQPGQAMTLTREALAGLPKVALDALGKTAWLLPVRATCTSRVMIVDGLVLYAYVVAHPDPELAASPLIGSSMNPPPPTIQPRRPEGLESQGGPFRTPGGGARGAILDAMDAIAVATGRDVISVAEVLDYLRTQGAPFADTTIRTMMSSHMRADRQGPGVDSLSDLDCVGRGLYRRRASPT